MAHSQLGRRVPLGLRAPPSPAGGTPAITLNDPRVAELVAAHRFG